MKPSLIVLSGLAAMMLPALGAADTVIDADSRAGMTLVVGQDGQALVRDRRSVDLAAGEQVLVVQPVGDQARDMGLSLLGRGLSVHSQQIDMGGLDAASLLAAHLGKDVTVVWRLNSGAEREERAQVLAAGDMPVFRIGGKAVAGRPERVVYDSLPPGMANAASYRADAMVQSAGKQVLELSYLSGGFGWRPVYTAESVGDKVILSAWARVENQSGMDVPQANLRLLAGESGHAVEPPMMRTARAEKVMMSAAMDAPPTAQALGPYHLYVLDRPASLRQGEAKQLPLLAPLTLKAERKLELASLPAHAWRGRWMDAGPVNPDAALYLRNTSDMPLPAGPVALMLRGKDGDLNPAGQDNLPAIPAGAPFRLTLGKAFDVLVKRVQTDVQKISADVIETSWEVRISNAGPVPEQVGVNDSFIGEWLILEESVKHQRDDAASAHWTVTVPAKGEAVLRYRVRLKM